MITAFLLPCSALCGAALLLLSDVVCRVLVPPVVLPIGALTSSSRRAAVFVPADETEGIFMIEVENLSYAYGKTASSPT